MGATPARRAKRLSRSKRPGCDQATSTWAAVIGADAVFLEQCGARWRTSGRIWRSSWAASAVSCVMRAARPAVPAAWRSARWAGGVRPQAAAAGQQPAARRAAQLLAELVGGAQQQRPQLVQGRGAGPHGTLAGRQQRPQGPHRRRARRRQRRPAERCASRGDGINWSSLAPRGGRDEPADQPPPPARHSAARCGSARRRSCRCPPAPRPVGPARDAGRTAAPADSRPGRQRSRSEASTPPVALAARPGCADRGGCRRRSRSPSRLPASLGDLQPAGWDRIGAGLGRANRLRQDCDGSRPSGRTGF